MKKKDPLEYFRPTADMVVIEPEFITKIGLIHVPPAAVGKSIGGRVIAVGPGVLGKDGKHIPTGLKPGDFCYVRWHFDSTVEVRGRRVMMVPASTEILGVRED